METLVLFCAFARKWMLQVSTVPTTAVSPLELWRAPTVGAFPLVCCRLGRLISQRPPKKWRPPFVTTYLFRSLLARTGAYSASLDEGGSERGPATAQKLSLSKWCCVWYLEQLMNGAARSSRQAAKQQLFQAEEVCLEGRMEGDYLARCVNEMVCVCAYSRVKVFLYLSAINIWECFLPSSVYMWVNS